MAASTVTITRRAIRPRPRSRVARFGWNAPMYAPSIDIVRTAKAAAAPTWRQSVVGLRRPSRSSFSMSAAVTTWPSRRTVSSFSTVTWTGATASSASLREPGGRLPVRDEVAADEAACEVHRERALVLGELVAGPERQLAHDLRDARVRQLLLEGVPEQTLGLAGDQVPARVVEGGEPVDRRRFERRLAEPRDLALALVRRRARGVTRGRDVLEKLIQAGPLALDHRPGRSRRLPGRRWRRAHARPWSGPGWCRSACAESGRSSG